MKKVIFTKDAPRPVGPYSQAVETNGLLFIAGQVPVDPATGRMVEGGVQEQADQVLKNMGAILQEAGYTFSDVVKVVCMLSDMGDFQAMNAVYGRYFTDAPPARAAFAVRALPLGALVEMEAIAAK